MPGDLETRLPDVEQLAFDAGELLCSYIDPRRMGARAKGERDVVTEADLSSERLIRERLASLFPDDAVTGEEGTATQNVSGRRWYVDPLDGTLNFSRGVPIWAVSLALFEGGQPILGVVRDPLRGETFSAVRDAPALLNGKSIACSGLTDFRRAVVHVTVDIEEVPTELGMRDLERLHPHILRTRNIGSAALGLAYVAAGRLDAIVHRYAHTWDFGAGVLLVRQAGGVVTSVTGEPYSEECTSVLAASTPELHAAILAAVTDRADGQLGLPE